jgi:type IV pilus assembly protein PilX
MKPLFKPPFERARIMKQRGVVLFFALIAMLAIMLAAVALVRSVDTSTMIAGNLAFKQAATVSGDAGTEAAIALLAGIDTANVGTNVLTQAAHPFNITNLAANPGYYSSADPALNLFADATWDNDTPANPNNNSQNSIFVGVDSSGNKVRYVVQRMCRTPNVAIRDADCLFSGALVDTNGQNIKLPQDICKGDGCPAAGQSPQIRITSRTTGPKNTLSYVQAFVY